MKQIGAKIGLVHTIQRISIAFYGIAIICFAFIGVFDRLSSLRDETENIRYSYTEEQKLIVKTQVQSAVQFIDLGVKYNLSKDEILESLKNIRFGSNRDGYIFVNTYGGIPLLFDAQKVVGGKSIWELIDPNGVKVIQEEREAVRNPEGDFIYYSWLKLSSNTISPKVSFIKGVPEWEWLVGAGVYLDSIEKEISDLQKKVMFDIGIEMLLLILVVLLILFIIKFFFRRFTKNVETEIKLFSSYFDIAAINSEEIDISNIRYKEFSHIAEDMNHMVKSKWETEELRLVADERLRLQRDQSPLGYVEWDLDYKIIDWNLSAEKIFGFSREEIIGSGFEFLISQESIPDVSGVFTGLANATGGTRNINKNITKESRTIICEWYNKVLKNKSGEILSYVSLVDDITERKLMEDQLEKSLEEKQILLKEVHHRVKNNMAIVSSFISLQSMNVEDEEVHLLLQSTENRVRSMALIHEYLYKSENLKDIDVSKYIEELVKILLESYEYGVHEIKTTMEIDQFDLDLDLLIPLGMIINEIISNALKHAFVEIDLPELFVSLVKSTGSEIILTLRDNGVGLPDEREINENDSIGFLLINSLVAQINGKLEIIRQNGTEYIITVTI